MDANDLVANSFTFSAVSVDNTWGPWRRYRHLLRRWQASTDVHAPGVAVADFVLDTQVLLANLYSTFIPARAWHRSRRGVAAPTPGLRLEDITAHEFPHRCYDPR
jgi:hypothetical protein